jgi:hypothetical protein
MQPSVAPNIPTKDANGPMDAQIPVNVLQGCGVAVRVEGAIGWRHRETHV